VSDDKITILKFLHVNTVRNYATHTAIHDNFEKLAKSNFWRITYNATLDIAVIDWCKLFGTYGETTHYRNCVERGITDFAAQVLSASNITATEYEALHKSIVDYRNRGAAHIDLDDWQVTIPQLSKAIEVAYVSFDIFAKKVGMEHLDLRGEFGVQHHFTVTAIDAFANRPQ
jgi:hypothetical protein